MITMRLLPLSKILRRRWLEVGCLALPAAFLAVASAETTERPITDVDVERYLPRLRAEASALAKDVREARELFAAVDSAITDRMQLYNEMSSGKVDVLAWIRGQTGYALVPTEAIYNADCAREITADWMVPTAIFTFGKESAHRDLLRRATAGDTAALNEFYRRRGSEEIEGRSDEAQALYDLAAKTVSFYLDRGFTEVVDPLGHSVLCTPLASPDRTLFVDVWEVNPYAGVLPRNILHACAELPTGPMIEMTYGGEPGEEQADAAAQGAAAPAETPNPEYDRVKEALLLAHLDAANPSAIDIEIPPDAPPEVKAKMAEIRAEFAVRRDNLAVYIRHEAELAPVLETLLEAAGQ
jgi:hypothetical protein